ncbi:HesB/YadR/YfhF family protein [Paenibacillus sp. 1P07SE]|uniref:HesB/YadR/YfhF family protein n=1 Tax=Paenibacillus sp. 1P07SE TaxID=3132209 RepID=UPI0039A7789D
MDGPGAATGSGDPDKIRRRERLTMKLVVEEKAARWYKEEMALSDGDHLRLFIKLGGCGSVVPGLSLGIMRDEPRQPGVQAQVQGVNFYMEQDQLWYLDNRDLHISIDDAGEEIHMEVR